jgi:transposase
MQAMRPYSEDLRTRIVQAVRNGMSKSATARLFGLSLSSVKRYARTADRGASLMPRKGGGRPPKADEVTRKLLQADVEERPAATVSERRRFLECTTAKILSDSTIRRLPSGGCSKVWASPKKTGCGGDRTRRMAKSRLEGDRLGEIGPGAVSLRRRDRSEHFPFCPACLVAPWGAGALLGAP